MWKKSKGFSLMELLVVMFIISLLSVLILANYRSGQKKYALDQAAQKLASDIRKAQNMAMGGVEIAGVCDESNQCYGYGVHINDVDNNFYIIYAESQENSKTYQYPDPIIETVNLPNKIKIDSSSSVEWPLPPKTHIFFEPPEPTTFINGKDDAGKLGIIVLAIEDTSLTKKITVTTAGLIYVD